MLEVINRCETSLLNTAEATLNFIKKEAGPFIAKMRMLL